MTTNSCPASTARQQMVILMQEMNNVQRPERGHDPLGEPKLPKQGLQRHPDLLSIFKMILADVQLEAQKDTMDTATFQRIVLRQNSSYRKDSLVLPSTSGIVQEGRDLTL